MHVDQELSHSPNFPRNCRQVVGSLVQTPAEHMPESVLSDETLEDLQDFSAVNAEDNPTLWPLGKDKKNHAGGSMCSDYTGGETGWSASGTCSSAVNDYKGTLFAGSTAEDFSGDVQEALDGSTAEDFPVMSKRHWIVSATSSPTMCREMSLPNAVRFFTSGSKSTEDLPTWRSKSTARWPMS